MTDSPKINLVLADLEQEAKSPEPYIVALRGGKRITFKDPFGFKLSEREEILDIYERVKRGETDDLEFLKRILSEADYQKYVDADLPIRVHEKLVEKVMTYFQGSMGNAGEGNASAG